VAINDAVLVVGSQVPSAFLFRRYGAGWFEDDRLARSDAVEGPGSPVAVSQGLALCIHYVYDIAPDNTPPIPTLSLWGLLVMLLLILSAATILVGGRGPRPRVSR
jgi:hypothetical protein